MSSEIDKKKFVLILDDDPSTREILVETIKTVHPNSSILECDNGSDAAIKVLRQEFDLIILETKLKGSSGFDLIHALSDVKKSLHPKKILILSGHFDRKELKNLPLKVDFIAKPTSVDVLERYIQEVLNPSPKTMQSD